ncbi:putative ribosomal protein S21e [Medicago truncatula]|nr:putative ribosomal protein S21e [Medicago truncatula]
MVLRVYGIIYTYILFCECDSEETLKMQNEEGQITELYIPRKCSATNRLITAKDHASVQINVGHLDESGVYNGQFSTFALCGFTRAQGDADSGIDRLWQKKKAEIKQ